MLKNLNIKNYRTFRNFTLDSVARVNLIVGDNNSGKSSLLEAIYLLTSEGSTDALFNILYERGEFVLTSSDFRYDRVAQGEYQVAHIFHGHHLKSDQFAKIKSNQSRSGSEAYLKISFKEEPRQLALLSEGIDEAPNDDQSWVLELEYVEEGSDGNRRTLHISEDGLLPHRRRPLPKKYSSPEQKSRFITTNFLGYDELAVLWDNITLTPREDKVVEALKILEPRVERISFTSRQTSNSGILLKLEGETEPIPLGSMGDGMRRILAVAASLVSVENGTLLVDEIDTGLYYGALTDMWRLILETAGARNAQVFATTHSWDCVRSFQEALQNFPDQDMGLLIRLERRQHHIQPISYSKDELDIAIQQDIEVR